MHLNTNNTPRPLAFVIAFVLVFLFAGGLKCTYQAAELTRKEPVPEKVRDIEFYRSVIHRLKSGENYYDALEAELRPRGYPTGSIFNWRPPLHLSLEGLLPPIVSKTILSVVALFTIILAWRILAEHGHALAIISTMFLAFSFIYCIYEDWHLFSEVWAGIFMTCSALLLATDRWKSAVIFGLMAVLLRELVMLNIVVALALAIFRKDRKQTLAWVGTILVFVIYIGLHALEVKGHLTNTEIVHKGGWILFSGLEFVLATVRVNPFLLELPAFVTVLYLPLALLGLLAWTDDKAMVLRVSGIGFICAYFIVGRPENFYWGILNAPLLALGIGWAPRGIETLVAILRDGKNTLHHTNTSPSDTNHIINRTK